VTGSGSEDDVKEGRRKVLEISQECQSEENQHPFTIIMSYYQDGIIHLPASTHSRNYIPVRSNYGSTTTATSPSTTAGAENSGNLSLEDLEAALNPTTVSTPTSRSRKPDIGILVSIISFIVWIRLFAAMFYNSGLSHLENEYVKETLFIALVWFPSFTLTFFYFRSEDYQRRFRSGNNRA
jgi:hypothetical protein